MVKCASPFLKKGGNKVLFSIGTMVAWVRSWHYTMNMSVLPQAVGAPKPTLGSAGPIALLYVAILVIMLVTQLFTYDTLTSAFVEMNLPLSLSGVAVLLPVIIAVELFALPFLLRMTLSPAFRWFSLLCGWGVAAAWLFVTLSLVFVDPSATTVGFLGTVVHLTPGWWAVGVSVLFGVLSAWASIGLWPGVAQKDS